MLILINADCQRKKGGRRPSGVSVNKASVGEDPSATLLSALLDQVADPSMQKQARTVLDALFEILGDSIRGCLGLLVYTLSDLLDIMPFKVRAVIISAHASGNAFLPYFEANIRGLAPF